jgi:polyphosphate glucokinase
LKISSGPTMTAKEMVRLVRPAVAGWRYEAVSIGFPGAVLHGRPVSEPRNLGGGWVGFNFRRAFGCPVHVINDAAMQALGSYKTGRMLFLGLGTGLGSALIIDGVLEPMELAHLPYKKGRTYEGYIGKAGLKRLGKKKWRRNVTDVIIRLKAALEVDDVVVGGGNAKLLRKLPDGVRLGSNAHAFIGGSRLWSSRTPSSPRSGSAAA